MRKPSRVAVGLALGFAASVLWGSVNVSARYLVTLRGLDPMYVGCLRFTSGALLAVAFLVASGQRRELSRAAPEWPLLMGLGAVGIFAMGSMVFLSARYTASINSAIILNANPLFIVALAPLVRERVPLTRWLGVLVGLAGCALISLGGAEGRQPGSNDALGCLLAAVGALCWASYTVMGKGVTQRRGGLGSAAISLVGGAAIFLLVVVLRHSARTLTASEAAVALYLGAGPTAAAMLAWYRALEFVDASLLGPTEYVAMLVGTVLGWALLGETIGLAFVAGALAIVAGLVLATHGAHRVEEGDAVRRAD
jgi:drug/metabolite transporter (DMT)-like permease